MKKALSLLLAAVMLICCVPVTVYASDDDQIYYQEELFRGLADPSFTKETTNYDGYHFKVGTKSTWECVLYTLSAEVTAVKGKKATFRVIFNNHIAPSYPGGSDYEIQLYANSEWDSFYTGSNQSYAVNYTVDTAKADGLSTSGSGMEFFRIKVKRSDKNKYTIPTSNKYFEGIKNNREVEYGGGGAIIGVTLEDTYTLGYYPGHDFVIYKYNYKVTKSAITLGTYGFASVVQYRAKGASKWKEKSFAANKKMSFSKLKAGTVYQFHVLCKLYFTDPETPDKKQYILDEVTGIFNLTTSISRKPKVTSVKISKFKNGKKKTIPGYWESDGDWHPTETFNTATYTVTVKVKSAPKNVKGMRLKLGNAVYYSKGRKKSYTFKVKYQDKKKIKGKKIKSFFAWSSNSVGSSPLGLSPSKTVTYRIRNGTTKVK